MLMYNLVLLKANLKKKFLFIVNKRRLLFLIASKPIVMSMLIGSEDYTVQIQ